MNFDENTRGALTEDVMKEDCTRSSWTVGFPSQGSQQGNTVLVFRETKTKAISTVMVPNSSANEYFATAVVDVTSACVCGRATPKSDGEPAVALQETVKNARRSDTILAHPPTGDSQSNHAAENAVRGGMIRTWMA